MRDIFVPGIGQYDNIGDIVLRRQLIEWLRPLGRLHVFIGRAPEGYADGLGVRDTDVVYHSWKRWYLTGLRFAASGSADYVFKPGEIQLSLLGMKEHISALPLLVAVRASGGRVIRVGSGSRNFALLPKLLILPSMALSNYTSWRDRRTAEYLGFGSVMPDLAFGEGPSAGSEDTVVRDRLVVSMRSDRRLPSPAWFAALRSVAVARGLRITVVTQVLRDRERSALIAAKLDGELIDWDGSDHFGQENQLRGIYRETALCVSDRLHVLITGLTEGAMPIALLVDGSDKIARHFEAASITGVSVSSFGMTEEALVSMLEAALLRRTELAFSLEVARGRLASVRADVARLLAREEAPATANPATSTDAAKARPTAWHVGRRGEVAGGMTQVVNAYLRWDFELFDVRVIRSREGSKGLRAVGVFAMAALKIISLGRSGDDLVIVHLAQNGSFIREGLLLRLAHHRGLATVAHLHGSSFVEYSEREPARVGSVLRDADRVLVLSESTREAVERFVDADQVVAVRNAVLDATPSEKANHIVFGGNVTRRKGVDTLVKAWRRVGASSGWHLHIVGPWGEPDLIVDDLPDATFTGPLPHDELMILLESAKIAVLPSRDEAMPMFVLEAMARGCAVVATEVGGIPTVLSDGTGMLIMPDDVDALSNALRELMASEALRSEIAAAGATRFTNEYSASALYPRLERLWHDTLLGI